MAFSILSQRHPLEPLTAEEVQSAAQICRTDGKLGPEFRFVTIALHEPAKEQVLAYKPGQKVPRQAFAILLNRVTGRGHEAVVDLVHEKVISMVELPDGVQPGITLDEFLECEEAVKRSPEFLAALKKRGVSDVSLVMVDPWSAGVYGTEIKEDEGKRLSRALCWVRSDPTDNGYARPIDGLIAVVDLHQQKVVRIEDYGVIPLPAESSNWTRSYIKETRTDIKPLEVTQAEGPSFQVEGNEVSWQKWNFRIGFTPREGLVLHTINYTDAGKVRPVMYRASIAEMVVPYGDPQELYFRKNAFDLGEYGLGQLANSLTLGCDCLGFIRYFDAHMNNTQGQAVTIKNAVCMHEEDYGILWKHTDWRTNETEVRRSRRLVVSFIATVANYEYGFFWYFYQDGSIQLEIKLTGMMNTTALKPGEEARYGTEIAPRLLAPFHQHFFCARLDMCVDGQNNSVYEVNTKALDRGQDNPHGNGFVAEATLFKREEDAQRTCNSTASRFWRVVNPQKLNRFGQPVGYRLMPGENCLPYAKSDAAVIKRAGFLKKHLWVTPFDVKENYPAGDYPNQNPGGDGLPKYTAGNRSIENTNVVLWYTFGHNHTPRPEDWPVMPVAYIGFMLKPDGFFDKNPALDLPVSKPEKACCAK
jgi:primary-amine oxidase